MAPPEAGKAREVAVSRDELAAVLDGQGGEISIRYQRALDVATQAGGSGRFEFLVAFGQVGL